MSKTDAIREIIRTDPLARGYPSLSDEEIADHITANRLYTEHVGEVALQAVTKTLARRGKLFDLIQQAQGGNPKAQPIGWVIQSSGWETVNLDDAAALAGKYYHEVQIVDDQGNVVTVTTGRLRVARDLA